LEQPEEEGNQVMMIGKNKIGILQKLEVWFLCRRRTKMKGELKLAAYYQGNKIKTLLTRNHSVHT